MDLDLFLGEKGGREQTNTTVQRITIKFFGFVFSFRYLNEEISRVAFSYFLLFLKAPGWPPREFPFS